MSILIVDDDRLVLPTLEARVKDVADSEVESVDGGEKAWQRLQGGTFRIVITDWNMPTLNGQELIRRIRSTEELRDLYVVVLTQFGDHEHFEAGLRAGADGFLTKPLEPEWLRVALWQADVVLNEREARVERESGFLKKLVGSSPSMDALRKQLRQVSLVPTTVLILGETGTGKSLAARLIHDLSPRAAKRFVEVNCGAFTAELLGSELFGHERGAFTGALTRRRGVFELAEKGTIFLDEIGAMPMDQQARLLGILDGKTFRRLGGEVEVPLDVRIVAATNKDLSGAVRDGSFRPDLLARLKTMTLRIPPLRERREDLVELFDNFHERLECEYGLSLSPLAPDALDALFEYDYPMNVRDIADLVERLLVFYPNTQVEQEHIRECLFGDRMESADPPSFDVSLPCRIDDVIASAQRTVIRNALKSAGGIVWGPGGAAKLLGLAPKTLADRMQKLGVKPDKPSH